MAERQDTHGVVESKPDYRLAGGGRHEAEDDRLGLLERIFDPVSRRRRELVQPGWRCLEVGAGLVSDGWCGSLSGLARAATSWRRISMSPTCSDSIFRTSRCASTTSSTILGRARPGLVRSGLPRLMLFWLAGKQESAIRRMVECLRPGGWLVDEDGDWVTIAPAHPSRSLLCPGESHLARRRVVDVARL